jgi:MFS transporter, CP family, cyanate transporter
LRLTLLAIPPVIPQIHRDLRLSETGVAALMGLPVLLFAAAAVPGSLMIARLGAHRALIMGVLLTAVASGFRGIGPSVAVLFATTFLMGVGIAVSQPAVPALIHAWLPRRIGVATALYVNGILIGEVLSASLTIPLVLPLVTGRWGLSLAVWAVPVGLMALGLAAVAPRLPDASGGPEVRWWPEWTRAETWQLGLLMGGASVSYFTANSFIPDLLRTAGRPGLIGPCLTALNAGQLPASLVIGAVAPRVVGRRGPFVLAGVGTLAGLGVFLLGSGWELVLGAAMLGFCAAFILILALALPPLLATPGDVHRLSAAMFAIGYTYSFLAPLLGGVLWDLSRIPAASLLPVVVSTLTLLAGTLGLRRGDRLGRRAP